MGVPQSNTAVAITNTRARRIRPPYRSVSSRGCSRGTKAGTQYDTLPLRASLAWEFLRAGRYVADRTRAPRLFALSARCGCFIQRPSQCVKLTVRVTPSKLKSWQGFDWRPHRRPSSALTDSGEFNGPTTKTPPADS